MPVLWFFAVLALIPLLLWLLKRSPVMQQPAGLRVVQAASIGPGQRLLTVEVGQGEARRWLLLGATAQQIRLLTELPPQDLPTAPNAPSLNFAQLLRKRAS